MTETRSLMPTAPRYRADIDGLRALSILLVVVFHLETRAFTGGYIGVDVFFVISGFLITGILIREASDRRSVDLARFYGWRARRLLPLSAIVLLCTIAVGFLLLPPIDFDGLLGDIRAAALYVSNWRFAGQATTYSAANPSTSLVVHYCHSRSKSSSISCGRS